MVSSQLGCLRCGPFFCRVESPPSIQGANESAPLRETAHAGHSDVALAAAVGVGAVHDAAHGHLVLGARLLQTVHLP